MCLFFQAISFALQTKSSVSHSKFQGKLMADETQEEYQKSGGKGPYNASICILVLLCNAIKAFSFHMDSASSTALQTCQGKILLSLISFLYSIHMQRPLNGAGSGLHDIFEMYSKKFLCPHWPDPMFANICIFYWSHSYILRNAVFSKPCSLPNNGLFN